MWFPSLALLAFLNSFVNVVKMGAGIHLPIYRRGGRFAQHEFANITALDTAITHIEERYARTYTDLHGNRIVRRWRDSPIHGDRHMLDEAGFDGIWYAKLQLGEPPQTLEFDLDMLSPDFYTIMTTNDQGSRYDTFKSNTYEPTTDNPHAVCHGSSDVFHFPDRTFSTISPRLMLPVCHAPKCSRHTLAASGSILGLSPISSKSLSRLTTEPLVKQLWDQQAIHHNIYSIAMLDSSSGILSIGSTIAAEIETIKIQQEAEFKYLGRPDSLAKQEEIDGALNFAIPPGSTHRDHFKWMDVDNGGAAGWHTTLVAGVWVNGIKVLKNQPVLLDLNCPVILAPPQAAQRLHESMSGTKRLTMLVDKNFANQSAMYRFWTFPCLNVVNLEFEIAGRRYTIVSNSLREDDIHGPAGGRFSLGKVELSSEHHHATDVGTGYCISLVVQKNTISRQISNVEGLWVLGEPFFRGLGVTFDFGGKNGKGGGIGVRTY